MNATHSAVALIAILSPRRLAVALVAVLTLVLLVPIGPAYAGTASYTGTNTNVDVPPVGETLCRNGAAIPVNCNIYTHRDYVWMNAGSATAALTPGDYFFAVLEPGTQSDPNDASPAVSGDENLSDEHTSRAQRTFTVGDLGVITVAPTAHDFDSNKIRLMPYSISSSPGGVHILAICSVPSGDGDADPRDCKYDAYKVQGEDDPPATVNAIFQGTKFYDANGNGMFDTGETGIEGWAVNVYGVDGGGVRSLLPGMPVSTDSNGDYFFESPGVSEGTTEHFVVCEVQDPPWRQTGPVAIDDPDELITDAFEFAIASATGGATVAAGSGTGEEMCYDVQTDGATTATASFLDFFNVPDVEMSGAKYYDANTDGDWDAGEAPIAGWPVSISDSSATEVCRVTTGVGGVWTSDDCATPLLPGTYTVAEVQPATPTPWFQTGNLLAAAAGTGGATNTIANKVYTVVLPALPVPETESIAQPNLDFGNACTVTVTSTPGGKTKGFWRNKNGQKLLTAGDFSELTALNLVNQNGSARNFTGSLATNKSDLKAWLEDSTATNMAYMLSAQMAATVLSINHGFTDPNAAVDANGTTVQDVIDAANASLGTHPFTKAAGTARTYQKGLKNILDKVNNNQTFSWSFTSSTACALPTTWAS